MTGAGWLTLREIDERHRAGKGSAFRAFKRLEPTLAEGRDFRVLAARGDASEVEALRRAGRIYASSVNVVLLSPATASRLRIASGRG